MKIPRFHNSNCIVIYILCILTFYIQQSIQQQPQIVDCVHPSNFSDFTILLMNHSVIVTGGTLNALQVWTQDLTNGLDTNTNCWTDNSNILASTTGGNITVDPSKVSGFQPYEHGIGFKYSNTSFAVQAGDNGTTTMSTMALFDLTINQWTTPPPLQGTQPVPKARMSVSLNKTTNIAWYYGGRTEPSQSQSTNYFNSFYNFDINSNTWNWPTTLYSGGYRPARYGHSSNLISERLFIIGGKTAAHSSSDNSWVLSSGDFQSVLVYDTVTHQGISMATIGEIPPARYSFSAVNAPDGRSIVLFGGQNASQNTFDASNDIYVLDTCTLNWSQPTITGNLPIARAGHEAVTFLNQYMIVMMGIQNFDPINGPIYIDNTAILDMNSWTWIDSIPPMNQIQPTQPAQPTCRFTFPVVLPTDDGGSNNNSTSETFNVVSNTNNSPTTKQLAFGITFGVLGFLLLATAFVIFILRIRRDVDAKQNPRWIPAAVLRKKKHHTSLNSISSS